MPLALEVSNHLEVSKHLLCKRYTWVVVTRRVVVCCSHVDGLDDAILDEHRKTLASIVSQDGHGTRVVKDQPQGFGELTPWISQECNHRPFYALVLSPTFHDCTIIDTVHENISDTFGLQLSTFCQVARNLL